MSRLWRHSMSVIVHEVSEAFYLAWPSASRPRGELAAVVDAPLQEAGSVFHLI